MWGPEGKVDDVLKSSQVSVSENLQKKSLDFLSKGIEALAVRQPNQTNPRSSADDSAGPLYTVPDSVEPKKFGKFSLVMNICFILAKLFL